MDVDGSEEMDLSIYHPMSFDETTAYGDGLNDSTFNASDTRLDEPSVIDSDFEEFEDADEAIREDDREVAEETRNNFTQHAEDYVSLPDIDDYQTALDESAVAADIGSSLDFPDETKPKKQPQKRKAPHSKPTPEKHKRQRKVAPGETKLKYQKDREYLTDPIRVAKPGDPTPLDSQPVRNKIANGGTVYRCQYCHVGYCQKTAKDNHELREHFTAPIVCRHCDREYRTEAAQDHHIEKSECYRRWRIGAKKPEPPPVSPPFQQGPQLPLGHLNAGELFLHFYLPVIAIWVINTNIRAEKLYPEWRQRKRKHGFWKPLTIEEGIQWLKLLVAWSVLGFADVNDPWRRHILFNNKLFVTTMSGARFNMIRRASCFCDPKRERKKGSRADPRSAIYDPLWRIIDVVNALVGVSQQSWYPGRNIAVDEMMVKFLGKWSFSQYISSKPIPCGVKFFVASCPESGYVLNFYPYAGQKFPTFDELGFVSHTAATVISGDNVPPAQRRSYLNCGHQIFVDCYYTTFRLIEWLKARLTYLCGVIQPKRFVPPEGLTTEHENGEEFVRGDSKFMTSSPGDAQLTTWLDKKRVLVASSIPSVTNQETLEERKETVKINGKNIFMGKTRFRAPCTASLYLDYMLGVDRSDQLISYCHFQYRTNRWYMPVFFQCVSIALLNAHIIYKHYHPKCMDPKHNWSSREFRLLVVENLDNHFRVKTGAQTEPLYKCAKAIPKDPPVDIVRKHGHKLQEWKAKLDVTRRDKTLQHRWGGIRNRKRLRCAVDWNHRTRDACVVCKVPLCRGHCSKIFHSDVDLAI